MYSVYAKDIIIFNTKFVSVQDILDNKYDIKSIELNNEISIK